MFSRFFNILFIHLERHTIGYISVFIFYRMAFTSVARADDYSIMSYACMGYEDCSIPSYSHTLCLLIPQCFQVCPFPGTSFEDGGFLHYLIRITNSKFVCTIYTRTKWNESDATVLFLGAKLFFVLYLYLCVSSRIIYFG